MKDWSMWGRGGLLQTPCVCMAVLATLTGCELSFPSDPKLTGYVYDHEGKRITEYEIDAKPGVLTGGEDPWLTGTSGGITYPTPPTFKQIQSNSGLFLVDVYDECDEATVFVRLPSGKVYAERVSMAEAGKGALEITIENPEADLFTSIAKREIELSVSRKGNGLECRLSGLEQDEEATVSLVRGQLPNEQLLKSLPQTFVREPQKVDDGISGIDIGGVEAGEYTVVAFVHKTNRPVTSPRIVCEPITIE